MKFRPLTKFEQGYVCALSNLIGGFGVNTEAKELYYNLGVSLDRILSWEGLCEYDKDNLIKLKDDLR